MGWVELEAWHCRHCLLYTSVQGIEVEEEETSKEDVLKEDVLKEETVQEAKKEAIAVVEESEFAEAAQEHHDNEE